MPGITSSLTQKMIPALLALAPDEGYTRTRMKEIKLLRVNESMPHTPVLYEPCIVIVLQGKKTGLMGGEEFTYDPGHYLVVSAPLPFTSQTTASQQQPLLAMSVSLDVATIAELLIEMGDGDGRGNEKAGILFSTPLGEELADTVYRLLMVLSDEEQSRILGPGILKELYYRVLIDTQGAAIRAALSGKGHFRQIAAAIRTMHTRFMDHIEVDMLAKEAGMSSPSFHRHFRVFTGTTPKQYLISIRLHQARFLMVKRNVTASEASFRVGYISPTQFSREFSRFFGCPPQKEAQRLRHLLKVKAESYWPE
ncbi:AraC family transcriptional regulator [Kosakonia oryziphila]|uniref:AraC-type DNA-binding protein n=1 Tax=Kosakonia oryziphila TaxID=1005667 RepID=A0A1C4GB87_9ENTR|nr:AraC family transcriptional regulator [Kosakonia oryziphila]SCC65404.1 AraC-type DNA-binding protein [Kosakonia oryziphila]